MRDPESTLVDRVKVYATSSGTGAFQLGEAVRAYRGVEALRDGQIYSYAVESGAQYEAGRGEYVASLTSLTRTPTISSDGGVAVDFPANVEIAFTALATDLSVVSARVDAALAVGFETWAELVAFAPNMQDGDRTTVSDGDTGTHTDPASGLTVPNAGVYEKRVGFDDPVWLYASPAQAAQDVVDGIPDVMQPFVDAASDEADRAEAAADDVTDILNTLGPPTLTLLPRVYSNLDAVSTYTLDTDGYVLSHISTGEYADQTGLNYSEALRTLRASSATLYPFLTGVGTPAGAVLDTDGYLSASFSADTVDPTTTITAEKTRLARIAPSFTSTPLFVSATQTGSPRAGVANFFRIPAGVHANGADHAFIEARHNSSSDAGYIGLAWAVRTNGVWGPTVLLADEAGKDYHNPCPIFDEVSGDLHLLWGAVESTTTEAEEAADPSKAGRMRHAVYRDGAWRNPITNLALTLPFTEAQCPEVLQGRAIAWNLFYPGPGTGICMSDGFLIAPGWVRGADGLSYSIALRYDRMSRAWSAGGAVPYPATVVNLNEAAVAENDDGSLRINCRTTTGGGRVLGTSFDQGRTWTQVYRDTTYVTPGVYECILRLSLPSDGRKGKGLYYNVADAFERQNATIRFSLDGFATYPASRMIYPTLTETVSVDFEGNPVTPVSITHRTDYGSLWVTGPDTYGLLLEAAVVLENGTVGQYYVTTFFEFNLSWLLEAYA